MKQPMLITSIASKIALPQAELEKSRYLIPGRPRKAPGNKSFIPGYELVNWFFANIIVKGELEMVLAKGDGKGTICTVPATGGFFATGLQPGRGRKEFTFASLS